MKSPSYQQLTLFAGASRDLASLTVLPGSDEARRMTVTSGLNFYELLRNSGPLGRFVKMCLGSNQLVSPWGYLTWSAEPLPALRTVTSMWHYSHNKKECTSTTSVTILKRSVTRSSRLFFRLRLSRPGILDTEYSLLPTATTVDAGSYFNQSKSPSAKKRPTLGAMAKHGLWPTPRASERQQQNSLDRGMALSRAVRKNAILGQLNAEFVEWLMGFPKGWTDLTK